MRLQGSWHVIAIYILFMSTAWGQWSGPGSSGEIYYNGGNVGIGTANPASSLDVRANGRIASLYYNGSSNSWVEIGNAVAHMNLGVGAQVATSGVPYIWSASGNFMIGNDGAPTLFVQGMGLGNVGIGTAAPHHKLAVNGTIGAKEVIVTNSGWADYVFAPDYRLRSLKEVGDFIAANHHLPGIPSEAEVKEKGVSVGEMQAKLLAKIEELTLHMIEADQHLVNADRANSHLQEQILVLREENRQMQDENRQIREMLGATQ